MARLFFRAAAMAVAFLAAGSPSGRAETLVIGSVGKDVTGELRELTALAAYLRDRLGPVGIVKVEAVVLPTNARMVEAFREGRIDLYVDGPVAAAGLGRETGAIPIVRRWQRGVPEHRTEIVVRSKSRIRSLADLRGRVLALTDAEFAAGYRLPRAMLAEHKLAIAILKRPDQKFDRRKVGIVMSRADPSAGLSLLNGRVVAVAMDSQSLKAIQEDKPGVVRSIAHSAAAPQQVMMRSLDMPRGLAQAVAEVLTAMSGSEEGRRVLKAFKTDRFEDILPGGEASSGPVHGHLRMVGSEAAFAAGPN